MPVPDEIKAQTIRNLWYQRVAKPIQQAEAVVAKIRAAIVSGSLDGEFSGGEIAAMLAVEDALGQLTALPGVTTAESRCVPSHRGQAITIEGVND